MRRPSTSLLRLAALLAAGALGAQEAARPLPSLGERRMSLPYRKDSKGFEGHDRPDLRKDWNRFWFGGDASVAYLDGKAALAAKEMERWSHLMPGAKALPSAAAAVDPTWVSLGPTANLTTASFPDIDSGRPKAIVTHPTDAKTLYLATSGGGVFKCTNADLASAGDWTWTPVTDGLPTSSGGGNVSIGALAMSPADANTLYLGLGDAFDAEGRGFYKTTNGGTSWTQATGMGNATRTYQILPLTASTVLVGTNDGLKRSTDGGATFSSVSLGGSATGQVWTVQAFSATELVLSLQSGTTGTVWYSSDAGATWSQATTSGLTSPRRITLATSAASASTAWGIYEMGSSGNIGAGLLTTSDKGHTWTFVAAPTTSGSLFKGIGNQMGSDGGQGFYNHGLAVDPTNINRIFVGANLALYRTEDGGATWTQFTHWFANQHVYAHADNHATAWSKTGPATLFVANDGGLEIVRKPALASASVPTGSGSVNSDVTFIDNTRNKGLATHLVYNVGSTMAASPADSKYRVSLGLQDNGTRVRQDTGSGLQNSSTFEDGIGGDGFGTVIHQVDGNKMLGSLYYTRIYRSTNGGSSFSASSTGITESNDQNLAPFAPKLMLGLADATGNTVYTAVNDVVYKSTDFGSTWTAMNMTGYNDSSYNIRNFNAAKSDPQAVAVVTSGGSGFVTYNGGSAWTQFGSLPNNGLNMSYVWFSTTSATTLYAASVAPSLTVTHLWKSTNSGATWTSMEGTGFPTGIPVHVIQNDPTSVTTLYAGTDFGLYKSTDSGATWARYGQGLPMVAVRDIYIAPDASFIRAATFGRGVWEIPAVATTTAPAITTQPASLTVSVGQTATFTVVATGNPAPTYQWKKNGTDIAGATSASYTTPATVSGDNGASFTVVVTNSAGTVTSSAAILTVQSPTAPAITTQPANQTVTAGQTATFSVVATGNPTPTYQWKKGGADIAGATSTSYTTPATVLGDSGSVFTVAVTNSAGSVTSNPATLTVQPPAAPVITGQPQNANVLVGGSASFTVTATGTGLGYQWKKGGVAISGATSATLALSGLTLGDNNTTYSATVTNLGGSVDSSAATLKVRTRDLSSDGTTDVLDLAYFSKVYGTNDTSADLNGDGTVDDLDLAILLAGL